MVTPMENTEAEQNHKMEYAIEISIYKSHQIIDSSKLNRDCSTQALGSR